MDEVAQLPTGFADLPVQGYTYMTELQRFDHKVRCAVLDVLGSDKVGTWNVSEVLRQIVSDMEKRIASQLSR